MSGFIIRYVLLLLNIMKIIIIDVFQSRTIYKIATQKYKFDSAKRKAFEISGFIYI